MEVFEEGSILVPPLHPYLPHLLLASCYLSDMVFYLHLVYKEVMETFCH